DLRFAVATDWPSTALVSAQTNLENNRYDGQPFDLDDNDDVYQWVFAIARLDDPAEFDDIVAEGDIGLNYGIYGVYRTQDFEMPLQGFRLGEPAPVDPANLESYVERRAELYIPDIWV